MSLHLKVSNSLKSLSRLLAETLKQHTSVFEPIYIVTQTEGMKNWLRLQLAEQLGIAANISFLKPNDAIHIVYKALGGKYQESISNHDLTWLLYMALEEKTFRDRYRFIATYYTNGHHQDLRKRMALAEKMADLFDQYQIYRTDMIRAWNDNKGEDNWQKTLWRRTKEIAGEQFPDKTFISTYILESLRDDSKTKQLERKLPTIYFFGLSLITEYHIQLISEIANHIEVVFMMQNPAPQDYWFEDMSEKYVEYMKRKGRVPHEESSIANPLLTGWGKLIQHTFLLLFKDEKTLNHYEEIGLNQPLQDNLLHKIQHSIYHNQKDNIALSKADMDDGTITINSCYNPVREVEVLYNYLVRLVEQHPNKLSARDIVVMVSDIDMYASYIKAVFDNAPYQFKYTIADESYAVSDSISNTLIELLTISEYEFTSEKVVSLLDFTAIRNQFGITDTAAIRSWTETANIRFGFSGSTEDDTRFVSWEYGIQRLMYGICMSGAESYTMGEDNFYPLDIIEGSESLEVVRFVHFVETLKNFILRRRDKKTLTQWVGYVNDLITSFIGDADDNNEEDYRHLQHQLGRYNLISDIFEDTITYEVFTYHFLPVLNNARRNHTYASRGITFCSLIPMRSIPFKVVALLGMNYDKFPRKDKHVSFDLMQNHPRKGDRNLRENDKHLMLETLLSAESYFYISYIGQSTKDNSQLPPSALVDELLDFISSQAESSDDVRKNFIQKHPLHSFSRQYNAQNPRLYAYIPQQKDKFDLFTDTTIHEVLPSNEISIEKLISFFKSPIKAYYNNVLNIWYDDRQISLGETEIFELNNLDRWKLRNDLLHTDQLDMQTYKDYLVKTGNLPLKNKGLVEIERNMGEISFTKDAFQELTAGNQKSIETIELILNDMIISGSIDHIYDDRLIHYSFSKSENKHKFSALLSYLLLTASGRNVKLIYIANNAEKIWQCKQIQQGQAIDVLQSIVEQYKQGHENMIPFDFGIKVPSKIENLDTKTFNKNVKAYFENPQVEIEDPYLLHAYKNGHFNDKIAFEPFFDLATLVYGLIEEFEMN